LTIKFLKQKMIRKILDKGSGASGPYGGRNIIETDFE
jgi:hypothetical protein